MSTYVRQSSCSTFSIPTKNGNIKIHGAPLYPSVLFPVSDQTNINVFCNQFDFNDRQRRMCQDYVRNDNLVSFVTTQAPTFGGQKTQMLIQDLGLCQSDGLGDYLKIRLQNPHRDNSQVDLISSTCKIKIDH